MAVLSDLLPELLRGLLVTAQVFAGATGFAVVVGFVAGLARLSPLRLLHGLAVAYIEVFRGTSALVQLFWFYFVLPLMGVRLPPLLVGLVLLGLNYAAYTAELVRGAVNSVPAGQTDAARALNMGPVHRMRRIILPQAIVRMLPPLGNLQIELLKNTALVSFIGVHDLTFSGRILLQPYPQRTLEIFGLSLVFYFLFSLGVTAVVRTLERTLGQGMRAGET